MAAGLLEYHQMTQNGQTKEERCSWDTSATGDDPQTYQLAFLIKGGPRSCPVEVCSGRARTRTEMRMHFCSRHVWYIVIILEEGNLPHPRVSQCDMLV